MDVRRRIVCRKPAIWYGGNCIGNSSVPEKVIFRMMDQEAVVRDVDWLADIHTNRPSRLVGRVSLTAIKHIHPVDASSTRLGPDSAAQEKRHDDGCNHAGFFHGTTSKFPREPGFGSADFNLCGFGLGLAYAEKPHRLKSVLLIRPARTIRVAAIAIARH